MERSRLQSFTSTSRWPHSNLTPRPGTAAEVVPHDDPLLPGLANHTAGNTHRCPCRQDSRRILTPSVHVEAGKRLWCGKSESAKPPRKTCTLPNTSGLGLPRATVTNGHGDVQHDLARATSQTWISWGFFPTTNMPQRHSMVNLSKPQLLTIIFWFLVLLFLDSGVINSTSEPKRRASKHSTN